VTAHAWTNAPPHSPLSATEEKSFERQQVARTTVQNPRRSKTRAPTDRAVVRDRSRLDKCAASFPFLGSRRKADHPTHKIFHAQRDQCSAGFSQNPKARKNTTRL